MEKKILFVDLDGTLLDDNKNITPENLAAIQKATEAGHAVVVTTAAHCTAPSFSWRSCTWTSPAAMPSLPTAR